MTCPNCGKEMRMGYLFGSKDGAFSFENAKKAKGFVEITTLKANHRIQIKANCCEACRMVTFQY